MVVAQRNAFSRSSGIHEPARSPQEFSGKIGDGIFKKVDGGGIFMEIKKFTKTLIVFFSFIVAIVLTGCDHPSLTGAFSVLKDVRTLRAVAHEYAINTAGQPSGTYRGLSEYMLRAVGPSIPKKYTPSGIPNAFGGMGILESATNPYQYQITESDIPANVCQFVELSIRAWADTVSCSDGKLILRAQ